MSHEPHEPCSWCGGSGDNAQHQGQSCCGGCCVHCQGTGREDGVSMEPPPRCVVPEDSPGDWLERTQRVPAEAPSLAAMAERASAMLDEMKDIQRALGLFRCEPTSPTLSTSARAVVDDPALDATDGAHPAWWRGHDHATAQWRERVAAAEAERDALRAENAYLAPRQRAGQRIFNAVHSIDPAFANSVRATDVDPFNDDKLCEAFLRAWITTVRDVRDGLLAAARRVVEAIARDNAAAEAHRAAHNALVAQHGAGATVEALEPLALHHVRAEVLCRDTARAVRAALEALASEVKEGPRA